MGGDNGSGRVSPPGRILKLGRMGCCPKLGMAGKPRSMLRGRNPKEKRPSVEREGRTSVGLSGISRLLQVPTDQTNTWMLLPVDMKPHARPRLCRVIR